MTLRHLLRCFVSASLLIVSAFASPLAPDHLRCEGRVDSLGIDAAAPGFRKIRIKPEPGGGLTWAKASPESHYGVIATDWELEGDQFTLTASIPPNTTATIELPDGSSREVGSGVHRHTTKL